MKLVIRTALFHLLSIIIFALIYLYISEDFQSGNGDYEIKNTKYNNFTDCLLLSTTIQAGVGVSDLYPISFYSKIVLIIQQIMLIFTHLITLYVFTL
jgi:hypothetical protein